MAQETPPARGNSANSKLCPRCGYRYDSDWHYCPACGWDLKVLAGAQGAEKLQSIGASVVGLILVKEPPSPQEILPPKLYRQTLRYWASYHMGREKAFATAFPFLKPGIFVTTARALEGVEVVDVRTFRNQMLPAQILGYDIPSGIGVVQADVPGSVPLTPSLKTPRDSDLSWAICFPVVLGGGKVEYLPESFHRGRVSAAGLEGTNLVAFESLLRTDHTLEEGCDGGSLLDQYGAAAGMVLDDPDPGINYALPVADLKAVVEVLSEKKRPQRPFFGMGLVTPDDRRRAKFQLPAETTLPLVAYLIPGSPAEIAGVQAGDLLSAVAGEKVLSVAGAGARLLKAKPEGGSISLTVQRQGKDASLAVTPVLRPLRVLLSPSDEFQETLQANLAQVNTGSTSQQGLRITDLIRGGRGEKDGYHDGDLIVTVNGKGVRKPQTFDDIVRESNTHIFPRKNAASDDKPHRSTYQIVLGIRTAQGEKDERVYLNFFPDVLTAPVY
ncbi:MAG: PDZ domain-containing protein [Acidobacteria bacterium]|nr:PDZ domain-containing protein [Acidobacteriota bacterium]